MTRLKRKELGIDIDFLTTEDCCRKRDAITQRTVRSKTAGMIYCYRFTIPPIYLIQIYFVEGHAE